MDYMQPLTLEIPKELENMQLPSPELLLYFSEVKDRIIWIEAPIDDSLLFTIKQILYWNRLDAGIPKQERKPIKLLFFSSGGDLTVASTMVDILEISETPVHGVNMGDASSAALLILLACDKRYCLKSSTAVLHKGSAAFAGIANQIENSVEYYKLQLAKMKEYILDKTQIDTRTYNKRKDEDWWFNAEDQLKYGIVHEGVSDLHNIIGG